MIRPDESILPDNATPFERGLESAFSVWSSVFPKNKDGSEAPNLIEGIFFSLWNPLAIDERLLPYLAYGLGVSIWPEGWPLEKKRAFVKDFLQIRAKQGTADSIIRSAEALGIAVTVTETKKAFVTRVVVDTTGGVNIPNRDLLKTIRDICEAFVPERVLFQLETVFFVEVPVVIDARAISIRVREFSMATEPKLLLTAKGKLALSKALSSGTPLPVKEFRFGTESYEPTENQTDLKAFKEAFEVADIRERDGGLGVHITCVANSPEAYEVREAGLFDNQNNLLAILSRPDAPLTVKIDDEDLVFGFDLSFQNNMTGLISSANPGTMLNLSLGIEMAQFEKTVKDLQKTIDLLKTRITVLETKASI